MEPTGGQLTLFSQVGSRNYASHTAKPENERAKRMSATSGRRCLERFGRLRQPGSWAKTFAALLIGTEGWSSRRCALIWKILGTKYNRSYFQLRVLTHRTKDIESGLLLTPMTQGKQHNAAEESQDYPLLPTPTAIQRDHPERVIALRDAGAKTMRSRVNGEAGPNSILDALMWHGLLPTPTVMDTNCGDLEKIDARRERAKATSGNGNGFGKTLGELANRGLLSTPTKSDCNQPGEHGQGGKDLRTFVAGLLPTPMSDDNPAKNTGKRKQDGLQKRAFQTTGKTSQLNPLFTLEMMGFQPNHCDSAFEKIAWGLYQKKKSTKSFQARMSSGATKLSKPQETP